MNQEEINLSFDLNNLLKAQAAAKNQTQAFKLATQAQLQSQQRTEAENSTEHSSSQNLSLTHIPVQEVQQQQQPQLLLQPSPVRTQFKFNRPNLADVNSQPQLQLQSALAFRHPATTTTPSTASNSTTMRMPVLHSEMALPPQFDHQRQSQQQQPNVKVHSQVPLYYSPMDSGMRQMPVDALDYTYNTSNLNANQNMFQRFRTPATLGVEADDFPQLNDYNPRNNSRHQLQHDPNSEFRLPHPNQTKFLSANLDDRINKSKRQVKEKQFWTKEEDERLRHAVTQCNGRNWKLISEIADVGRTDIQCLQRWNQVLRPGLKKGAWSVEEDEELKRLVNRYMGTSKKYPFKQRISWKIVEKQMGGRTAKQCRERWKLSLDPSINKSAWTHAEDQELLKYQKQLGNSWALIKDLLQTSRTENSVKLRFKYLTKKPNQNYKRDCSSVPNLLAASKKEAQHRSKKLKVAASDTNLANKKKLKEASNKSESDDVQANLETLCFAAGLSELKPVDQSQIKAEPHSTDGSGDKTPVVPYEEGNKVQNLIRRDSWKELEFDEMLQMLTD